MIKDNLAQQFKEIFYKFLYYDIELKIMMKKLIKVLKVIQILKQ